MQHPGSYPFNGHRMNIQGSRLHELPAMDGGGGHPSPYWNSSRFQPQRPANAFETRRFLATPTLGESASGYNTPDNESMVSIYTPVPANFLPYSADPQRLTAIVDRTRGGVAAPPPPGSGGATGMLPWQRAYMTSQGPTGRRDEDQRSLSEFSQRSGQWGGVHGYSQTFDRTLVPDFQHPMLQRRRNTVGNGTAGGNGTVPSKRDSSTDDEMSAYEMESRMPRARKGYVGLQARGVGFQE